MDARCSHSSKGLMGFRAKDSFKILLLLFLSDQLNPKLRVPRFKKPASTLEVLERLELKLLHFAAVYRARVHQKSNPGIVHMQAQVFQLFDEQFSLI